MGGRPCIASEACHRAQPQIPCGARHMNATLAVSSVRSSQALEYTLRTPNKVRSSHVHLCRDHLLGEPAWAPKSVGREVLASVYHTFPSHSRCLQSDL